MYPLCSEHSWGTGYLALMCEEHVNRGPLKNDVSISMLMLGWLPWEERHLSEKQDGPPQLKEADPGVLVFSPRRKQELGWVL